MPQHALLNNVAHKDLRVITRFGAEFGDNVGSVLAFPTEYADLQREYPIFFRKDQNTGEFQSIVLLGFDRGENLFLEEGRWDATYVPGVVVRGPFLIGFQEREVSGELQRNPVIHVDLDHPRISKTEGEPVFLPEGGNSPYLNHVSAVLRGIHDGLELSKAMFAAFSEAELIEPVKVDVKLSESEQFSVTGLHTISRDKLRALDAEKLHRLHKSGFLEGAFLVLASLNNVRRLMARKQRKQQRAGNTLMHE